MLWTLKGTKFEEWIARPKAITKTRKRENTKEEGGVAFVVNDLVIDFICTVWDLRNRKTKN